MKLDILGSNLPSILHKLKELTGIDPTSIPLDDKETLNMICSANTTGIPEFENEFVRNIILETHPTTFDDLVKISGLSHGTGVWEDNAQELIKKGIATLNEIIACRDDIFTYLIYVGMNTKRAFEISEITKLKWNKIVLWSDYANMMRHHNVPEWYIKSCEKIKYMFPKAHLVGYVINSFRIAWYKVHYKKEFEEVMKEYEEQTQ